MDVSSAYQLSEMYLAPSVVAAVRSAASRPSPPSLRASTRSIVQRGQIAETISRSRDSSWVQSSPAGDLGGSGEVAPFWLYVVNWPGFRAGSRAAERYFPRSLAAAGSL